MTLDDCKNTDCDKKIDLTKFTNDYIFKIDPIFILEYSDKYGYIVTEILNDKL